MWDRKVPCRYLQYFVGELKKIQTVLKSVFNFVQRKEEKKKIQIEYFLIPRCGERLNAQPGFI